MIRDVTFEKTIFAPPPSRFEAGTPHIAGVIGLGAAIDFVEHIGRPTIKKHIQKLTDYATKKLKNIDSLDIIGNAPEKCGIISFVLEDIHPHDVTTILASQNIAIRAGHHCTQPIMDFYDISGTNRVSFSIYNTVEDIDKLIDGIHIIHKTFRI
jgi:cysteine desulfurase / selenocysteine lyase